MLKSILRLIFFVSLTMIASGPVLRAGEPSIIAKARAFLGGEAALNAVQTLHYYGTLTVGEEPADDAPKPISVEIVFQKPYRQRSIVTSERGVEVTVLDGDDGWQRVESPSDKTRWTLVLLKSDQIKSLRANVWENLAFFHGLEAAGGSVEDLGLAEIDGTTCRKLAFIHSSEVTFYRYFDVQTGRLVLTETKRGESIREEGTIEAAGIKFPRILITDTMQTDGSKRRTKIVFSRVTVNEPVPDKAFDMPSLISR